MAATLTYDSLVTQIALYLQRTDQPFIDNIPFFILYAQKDIQKRFATILEEVTVEGAFVIGNQTINKPALWLNTMCFYVFTNNGLIANNTVLNKMELRTREYLSLYWPDTSRQALPQYYADLGDTQWYVAPTPDRAYEYSVTYLSSYTLLDAVNQTNPIAQKFPELLFYRCLIEAIPFLQDDPRIPSIQKLYDDALASALEQNAKRITDRFAQRGLD